ncbi:MAG: penicillin-binding protein 2, partial [Terrimicrobiaceae bacterium]|nr:penicillin-binding protein 2 [Terrimicrobiaceae bacterium]
QLGCSHAGFGGHGGGPGACGGRGGPGAMRLKTRHRVALVCLGACGSFSVFSWRRGERRGARGEELSRAAAEKHSRKEPIFARRGMITDRHGEILAASVPVRRVVLDATQVNAPERLAEVAAPFLGMEPGAILAEIATGTPYKILSRSMPEERAIELRRALADQRLRGLRLVEDSQRVYPNGTLLCHVLGYLGPRDPSRPEIEGLEGVESACEKELRGADGFRLIEKDRTGREIVVYRGVEEGPRHGNTVELTIDMGLQAIVEEELDASCQELNPEMAVVILADPKTGEILALANRPNYDPGSTGSAAPETKKNRAIMDVVEPGSTFKIVVASAALAEGVVNEKTIIHCENGRFHYGGHVLRDVHGYGAMGVFDILVKSSNIGSAKMGLMLGPEKFYSYVRLFGFGERTGIELPGEVRGILKPVSQWDRLTITRMPMGHALSTTPLQITMAMAAIANGGTLLRPRVVRAIHGPDGREIERSQPEVVRQVVRPEVARFVGEALKAVTRPGGTAKLAAVPGFEVAGKTGTAQKVNPAGGYYRDKYVVSFAGYMPADDPAFVGLVMIDSAKVAPGLNYGGLVAAPIFARIAEKAARYMNLVPVQRAEAVLPLALGGARSEGRPPEAIP